MESIESTIAPLYKALLIQENESPSLQYDGFDRELGPAKSFPIFTIISNPNHVVKQRKKELLVFTITMSR